MPVATLISDANISADWCRLLIEILKPLGTVRAVERLPEGSAGLASGEPLIVPGAAISPSIPAALHGNVILAPNPFEPPPKRFLVNVDEVRVLSFSSLWHAVAQRAGLRSAFFHYFPNPDGPALEVEERLATLPDRLPSGQSFSLASILAMAHGRCVFCTESPIALDYIVNGVNGFITDTAISLTAEDADRIGATARISVRHGFERWQNDQARLADYVFAPHSTTYKWRWAQDCRSTAPWPSRSIEPVVTVATVVWNGASELRTTLPSILGQRFADMEVVLFDGGSTDGTLEVIREFAPHIHHWSSAQDGGPYDAMQKAALMARGRWILFMNAGDRFVDQHALRRLVEAAEEDADFVAGHHVYIDADGIETVNHCVDFEATYARLLAGDLDSAWIRGVPCHQAVLTRTDLIRRYGFDPTYRIAADHEFMYRMRRQGASFQVVPTIVAEYVSGGLSARQEFRCLEEWRRIAHAYSLDRQRADRSLDRLVVMAMKALRRQGVFDFSQEPAVSRPWLAASIDFRYRMKKLFHGGRNP